MQPSLYNKMLGTIKVGYNKIIKIRFLKQCYQLHSKIGINLQLQQDYYVVEKFSKLTINMLPNVTRNFTTFLFFKLVTVTGTTF